MVRLQRRNFLQTMGSAAVLTATGLGAAERKTTDFIVVGYLPWYRLKTWSARLAGPLTDLVYFGVQPTTDGELPAQPIDRETLETLKGLKRAIDCRLHLCIGGGDRSAGFAALAGQQPRRQAFAWQLREVCHAAGFDGVDYDWEHPEGETQLAAYADLLVETKSGLGPEGLVTIEWDALP